MKTNMLNTDHYVPRASVIFGAHGFTDSRPVLVRASRPEESEHWISIGVLVRASRPDESDLWILVHTVPIEAWAYPLPFHEAQDRASREALAYVEGARS